MKRHLTIVDRAAAMAAIAHEDQVRKQDGSPSAIPASAVGGSVRRAGAAGVTEDLTARQPLPSHEVVRGVGHGHVVP